MATMANGKHAWRFYRAGGVDQVLLSDAQDVLALDQLDQKLWVALSCPVKGLEFDERTLALLDTDHDGRVRAPEILATVAWLRAVLKDPAGLVLGVDGVPLSALNPATPEGQRVLAAAKHMLEALGKATATTVTVADAMQTSELLAKARLNGDGIVPPESIADAGARAAAEDLLKTLGGKPDRSGKQGYDAAGVETFFALLKGYDAWRSEGEAKAKEVLPLGEATGAASAAVEAVATKVDDWFVRGRMAAFDPRTQTAVNRTEAAYLEAAARDLSITSPEVRQFPLAMVEVGRPLPLADALNPAWQAEMDALRTQAVEPFLGHGKTTLTEVEWRGLRARLAPYRAWAAAKVGGQVEGLGAARVRALLAGGTRAALEQAIAEDLSAAPQIEAMTEVERLARCWRDLFRLLNNFVSFSDFYARRKATFQAGTLHLDARTTDLCVQVLDAGKHAAMAGKSGTYLAYVDCTRPGCDKMTVACAMTAGDSDNLFPGRNGLFYDRKGRDWDATVTKIVDNPISVGQAFWSPYKKLMRWVEDMVAKRAAAADEAANARLQAAASETAAAATATATAAPPPPPPPKPKFDVGVVAALGVAASALTAALGGILTVFFGLKWLMPLGVLGLILLISGPSMIIAWLKLRRRNLGPILDANGWAVNALTRVNIPLGRSLTDLAELPEGASRQLTDPFAPKKSAWRWLLPLLLVLGLAGFVTWKIGKLSEWIPAIPAPENPWFAPADCKPPTPPGPEAK